MSGFSDFRVTNEISEPKTTKLAALMFHTWVVTDCGLMNHREQKQV